MLQIKKGREKIERIYQDLFKESLRFLFFIKKDNQIIKRTLPYDYRTGKIKGKYLFKPMPKQEKEKILFSYENHLKKQLQVSEISLKDYLETAAICYRVYGKKEANKLSSLEMYKRWADGRDEGMLSLNQNSKNDFNKWLRNRSHAGHPFEIVFSWREHGIHLYPPELSRQYFSLDVTNYAYVGAYLKMLKELIKNMIAFKTGELNEVLEYLTGESYFAVNEYDKHFFFYIPSKEHKKKYFKKIEWDAIKIPKIK